MARRLTSVSGGTPSPRAVLMNRNELPQMADRSRNIAQVRASSDGLDGLDGVAGRPVRPQDGSGGSAGSLG